MALFNGLEKAHIAKAVITPNAVKNQKKPAAVSIFCS